MMIVIDGSMGEGGGQVLRSSLTLAAVTGKPVRIKNIRAGRARPGLMRQHLTALKAMSEVSDAEVVNAKPGSTEIEFRPGALRAGRYCFAIGTAGSTSLVLQTVLPALLSVAGESSLRISGGTHNPAAPPFEFLQECYFPALRTLGHKIDAKINRYGFFPAGGGEIDVTLNGAQKPLPFELDARGESAGASVEASISKISGRVAEREVQTAGRLLQVPDEDCHITSRESVGPGNVLYVRLSYEHVTALFAEHGERALSAEKVAKRVAKSARQFANSNAAITHRLADQLLVPMALARGGRFTTVRPSRHTTTNIDVVKIFMGCDVSLEAQDDVHQCVMGI